MTVIDTIFLDLDDVCNTLSPYALHKYGCPIGPADYSQYPERFGYAAHEVFNHYMGAEYTWEDFWLHLPQSFWAAVPTTDFFDWLVSTSRELVGEENVFLATALIRTPKCIAGKMEWILKFCPPWLQKQFSITTHKANEARPGALLIDDHAVNTLNFRKRHGEAILVPRPWNWLGCARIDPRTRIANRLEQFQFTTRGPL